MQGYSKLVDIIVKDIQDHSDTGWALIEDSEAYEEYMKNIT